MTAQVTGRIEYPYRADYEDQLVLPIGDKGLVIQSFAKDSKAGKRYFKTEFYSTMMTPVSHRLHVDRQGDVLLFQHR